jgi:prepilin-type processing-associated H-X9-DG protein
MSALQQGSMALIPSNQAQTYVLLLAIHSIARTLTIAATEACILTSQALAAHSKHDGDRCRQAFGNSYRTQFGVNSFRTRHVTSHVDDREIKPIKGSFIALSPVNKIITGDSPWHGNRLNGDKRSAWHNVKGKRSHNILFGDGHAQFYVFPKEVIFLLRMFI